MKNLNQDVNNLIRGIEIILSKDRCPLSDEEKVLLKNCLFQLKKSEKKETDILKIYETLAKWLLIFLDLGSHLKNLF